MGPYICYRYYTDEIIRIRKIFSEEGKDDMDLPGKDDMDLPGKERHIDLKPLINNSKGKKYITFSRINKNSF